MIDNRKNEAKRAETPGGQQPEPVEERPNVGQVSPNDYPEPASGADVARPGLANRPKRAG
ncbi:hypothetical protein [Sphingomonas xanthus]|uniref:Uncharacterized protein n=1 Tax=Sphingomonas xanthus TaxID=2594473 RepID=A0A516ISU3_9SPHN|nr:hypothetical protein [Sphingomonas xanthus]QDP19929.1 hypothetical protein FMM02_08155 [Sphingomonas xanthus]